MWSRSPRWCPHLLSTLASFLLKLSLLLSSISNASSSFPFMTSWTVLLLLNSFLDPSPEFFLAKNSTAFKPNPLFRSFLSKFTVS